MATQIVGRAGIGSDGPFQNLFSSSVRMGYLAPDILLRTLTLLGSLFAWWYERKGKVKQLVACKEQLASTQRLVALLVVVLFVVIFVRLRSR